jgi:hypothetical protein
MQKILKSLIKGIGALPIDFKGKIGGKEFVIKVQYKLDGSVGAQVWSGKDIIIELEGRSGEVEKKTQTFLDWAVEKKEQDLYKKKMLDFFKQVHKEVVDYNKKQGIKKKAEPKVVDMGPEKYKGPKKYWLLISINDKDPELNWYQKSGLKSFPAPGFPVGRFVIYKKGIYDAKTGVFIMGVNFGVEDTLGRFERGMKNISDPEEYIKDHAERTKNVMVANGTWPGDKPTSSESVRKVAPKKAKVDVFKAPVVEKKEVKAAPKKVAAKKEVETKTKSKTRQTGSSNLAKDKQRKSQAPGKRKSASGGVYYEYRRNRTDKPGSKV